MNEEKNKVGGGCKGYREHDCMDYTCTVWKMCRYTVSRCCSVCGCITHSRYRSVWMRIKSVFKKDFK